jgi:hypothetical protein
LHFDGRRPWFRCAVYSNGQYCGRRAAVLYAAGDLFACRHCYGLAYMSQQESPRSRLISRSRMVISGVAEQLEKAILSFVMLDAFFPETGQALVDLQPPAIRETFLTAARNGASTIPPRPAAITHRR